MKQVIILIAFITTILANFESYNPNVIWVLDGYNGSPETSNGRTPFPKCLASAKKSDNLKMSSLQGSYSRKIEQAIDALYRERYEHYASLNDGSKNYFKKQSEKDNVKTSLAATAAVKMTKQLMSLLPCDLDEADTEDLNNFLQKFKVPKDYCAYDEKPKCDGKRKFRTPNGVCNNEEFPFLGSSKTAFGRLVDPAYDDRLGEPRQKAADGGSLPSCRAVSLAMNSKSVFDRNYNNFFVTFGQYIFQDMALAAPVTDINMEPYSSCTCESKDDREKCVVIDVQANDPYFRGQRCMVFPATAQAFKDQLCTLGVKEQMNGNTHFLDLSTLYGNALRTTMLLRHDNGTMKSTKRYWLKYELPPAERDSKSCTDATTKRPCFATGDSRLMQNLLNTGINTMFLRFHNKLAKKLGTHLSETNSHRIFEITKQFTNDLYQAIVFGYWIPKLVGPTYSNDLLDSLTTVGYNKNVTPIVYNEIATAAFRLDSLLRDTFSRCTPKGQRIDRLSLHDISYKARYAYDTDNNGIDSILCGSFYDHGSAFDGNFAHHIQNRFSEVTDEYGNTWRNDLVSINICRGREHGVPSYNAFREYCSLKKAEYFEDFADTMSTGGIKRLKTLYQNPDDVDLFVGLNLEDPVQGGIVGTVSACLLNEQFRVLCEGDRFCVTHRYGLSKNELQQLSWVGLVYLVCQTVDIDKVPLFPFRPQSQINNPLINCNIFNDMDNEFLAKVVALAENPNSSTNKFTASIFKTSLEQYLLKPGFYDYHST